jgi:pyruvate dehydrogenase E1 component
MAEAFDSVDHDRPTCFLAYTIKGWGTPLAGHKDNHGGLMNPAQMADWQRHMGVPEGEEWEKLATVEDTDALEAFLGRVPFFARGPRRYCAENLNVPARSSSTTATISTQAGFGKILDTLAKGDSAIAARILTTSPDVTSSTNLGPWVNRRSSCLPGRKRRTRSSPATHSLDREMAVLAGQASISNSALRR